MRNYHMRNHGIELNALSLFSGAGGLDLGFETAGFRIHTSIEIDADARNTLIANGRGSRLFMEGDIFRIHPDDLLSKIGIKPFELTVLIAGPPCQPFSNAGRWPTGRLRGLADPRARTINAMLEVVGTALPQIVVIENVPGMILSHGEANAWHLIEDKFKRINRRHGTKYAVSALALNAVDFGVAQGRKRVFIIACRNGTNITPPSPTHGPLSSGGLEHPTAWDAIGDLDSATIPDELRLTGRWAGLLSSIPEGHNYLFHTSRGPGLPIFGWRTRYWTFLLKLAKTRPSWTISANPGPATGPFHWRNRLLSVQEIARLQSFPDTYRITGDYRAARRQIGNAVPPALAEAVARHLLRCVTGARINATPLLATGRRLICPPAEPVRAVPAQFRCLGRPPKAHPGPGLGPGVHGRRAKRRPR